jgi:hypothetical protein
MQSLSQQTTTTVSGMAAEMAEENLAFAEANLLFAIEQGRHLGFNNVSRKSGKTWRTLIREFSEDVEHSRRVLAMARGGAR